MRFLLVIVVAALAACAAPPPAPSPTPPASSPSAPLSAPAPSAGVPLVNPGFESTAPWRRNDPEGWFTFQHAGESSYRFTLDTTEPHGGSRSLRIDNIGPEPYGAIAQSIEAKPYAGKTARFTGWVRTRDVAGTGAVLTIVTLANGFPLTQNIMAETPIKGTTPWTRYTLALPVASNAERVEIGATLQGKGSLWFDDVELRVE